MHNLITEFIYLFKHLTFLDLVLQANEFSNVDIVIKAVGPLSMLYLEEAFNILYFILIQISSNALCQLEDIIFSLSTYILPAVICGSDSSISEWYLIKKNTVIVEYGFVTSACSSNIINDVVEFLKLN